MIVLKEKELEFRFDGALSGVKFDDPQRHKVNEMKAVDLIVEFDDFMLFVEVKDPDISSATPESIQAFREKLDSRTMPINLKYKFRDSLLYQWASGTLTKPVQYVVLLQMRALTPRDYQVWTDKIRRILPIDGPPQWHKQLATEAFVMNMTTWNRVSRYGSVRRISP